jgi:hypothetical protein
MITPRQDKEMREEIPIQVFWRLDRKLILRLIKN